MLFRLCGARRPAEADRAAELGKAGTDEKGVDAGVFWVSINEIQYSLYDWQLPKKHKRKRTRTRSVPNQKSDCDYF